MTENEILQSALEKVEAQQDNFGFMDRFNVDEHWAVRKALEEIQQYRAIGTVEDIQKKVEELERRDKYLIPVKDKEREEYEQYRAIGTIEEFKALKEYKAKMEMQYLDDMNNPLEPLKLSCALQSEIHKYNYRKKHKPHDINMLDYTVMYALKHCLEEITEGAGHE